jgi:DNA-binding response OmpR family regulator
MVNTNIHSRPCVLIIDDEEAVRHAVRGILQSEYDILEAESVDQGLDMLRQDRPDLITLDVRMPGRSGLEALKLIRESEEYTNTPVIMITGYASLDGACEALRLGATDYLQKPFGVDQLKTSIRNGLRRHESVRLPDLRNGKHAEEKNVTLEGLAKLGKASAAFVHDLASPLQVLMVLNSLCAQKLDSGAPDPARDQELFDALKQMESLLSWASELAKGWQTIAVPTGFCRESLDVDELLRQVVQAIGPYARLNQVNVLHRALPRHLRVLGDRIQLERALVNIGLNGIKAATSRGRTLEVGALPFGNDLVFRFVDSGQGFASERMKEVLNGDPFNSSSKTRRGLGLFIADWIALNHGGKLQFISEKGVGTTVELFIPAAGVVAEANGAVAETQNL